MSARTHLARDNARRSFACGSFTGDTPGGRRRLARCYRGHALGAGRLLRSASLVAAAAELLALGWLGWLAWLVLGAGVLR